MQQPSVCVCVCMQSGGQQMNTSQDVLNLEVWMNLGDKKKCRGEENDFFLHSGFVQFLQTNAEEIFCQFANLLFLSYDSFLFSHSLIFFLNNPLIH